MDNNDNQSEATFLDYMPGENYSLYITEYRKDSEFIVETRVYIVKGTIAYFDFLYTDTSTGITTAGKGNLTKDVFGNDYKLSFSNYSGDPEYREAFASLCAGYITNSLYGAAYIMAKNNVPTDLGDLGFDSFYFYTMAQ